MGRLVHSRLSAEDAEQLAGCLAKLDAIHDSVKATGMAGKLGIMQLTIEVYRTCERILHKELRAVAAWEQKQQKENGGASPQESAGHGDGAGADQAGAAGQEES